MLWFKNLRLNFINSISLVITSESCNVNLNVCRRHARWLNTLVLSSAVNTACSSTMNYNNSVLHNYECLSFKQRQLATASSFFQYSRSSPIERNKKSLVKKMFGRFNYNEQAYRQSGFYIYEKCTDGVGFNSFMQKCKLPDTYFSWFLVTELHVWMSMVRAMGEGAEGKIVRNGIVEALWSDAAVRAKKVGATEVKKRRQHMLELNEQFVAALFLYDEGLQSDDKVLAGALWYRLLGGTCDDVAVLVRLVEYVRQQTLQLEKYSRDDILLHGNISFSPL